LPADPTQSTSPPPILHHPVSGVPRQSHIGRFLDWLSEQRDTNLAGWNELYEWSITELEAFWAAVWDFAAVQAHTPYAEVLASREMPGAQWFRGATLNYAEHCLGSPDDTDRVAVLAHSQTRAPVQLTYGQLADQVWRLRAAMIDLGVHRGDRVVGYAPNIPEALVAFLATASLGAIWASCSPEFGARSVLDRFGQIEPVVLFAVSGYTYGDKPVDRANELEQIRSGLPTLKHTIHIGYGPYRTPPDTTCTDWSDLLSSTAPRPGCEPVPFDHPLFVLFSSGTTGKPKAIVHGHGGILLEHLKTLLLHWDIHDLDRLQWFTTTAWMMWNIQASALLGRASIVMLDGNPLHPDLMAQWRTAAQTQATYVGLSPSFVMACAAAGADPTQLFDLSAVREIGVSGSPLPVAGYRWIYEVFGPGIGLNVCSGGTDVCSGFVQSNPLLPVWEGEISGPSLAVAVHAYDPRGKPVVGEAGELVITEPMPSMPLGFWGDTDGSAYRAAYFDHFPGVWRHGDWVRFTPAGSCVITGRSDATLNRGGVRLGTGEFYSVLNDLDAVEDSLVVHLDDPGGGSGRLVLFVQTTSAGGLNDELRERISAALRAALSPRHVPDAIVELVSIPRNRTGKKLEVPVKRILQGAGVTSVVEPGAVQDTAPLYRIAELSLQLREV
jgi:acetoacetyl-CoA synthetase